MEISVADLKTTVDNGLRQDWWMVIWGSRIDLGKGYKNPKGVFRITDLDSVGKEETSGKQVEWGLRSSSNESNKMTQGKLNVRSPVQKSLIDQ